MSDYLYNTIHPYLELGKSINSPQIYLNPGYQAHWMAHATLSPVTAEAGCLTEEHTKNILKDCAPAEQLAMLETNGSCDFIINSPTGKQHIYAYAQESGPLVIALSLHVDAYLQQGLDCRASDIHLAVQSPPSWRHNGSLEAIWAGAPKLTAEDTNILKDSFLEEADLQRLKERGDIDFAYQNEHGRYRSSVVNQRLGFDLCFRIINSRVMTMEEINLSKEHIVPLTRFTNGIILVTGAIGTGKSTTLASIIDFINKDRRDHIITLEDPIETIFTSESCQINQREVHKHTQSFARALRAALREDPDVIMVGEMRDLETMSLALTAAETGHLVLGTLQTGSASRTIDRILDSFPIKEQEHIRVMVSESLRGILSQQLIPKKDGSGRVMAMEMLVNTAAIANCIREGKTFMIPGLIQTGKAQGMRLMDDALQSLYLEGTIAGEECINRATDTTLMRKFLDEHPEPKAPAEPANPSALKIHA